MLGPSAMTGLHVLIQRPGGGLFVALFALALENVQELLLVLERRRPDVNLGRENHTGLG